DARRRLRTFPPAPAPCTVAGVLRYIERLWSPGVVHNRLARRALLIAMFVWIGSTACGKKDTSNKDPSGQGGGAGGVGGAGQERLDFEPASGGVRRLLVRQYLNSVRVLFGDAAADA